MRTTEEILEFNQMKEKLAELALTKGAKQECLSLEPYLSETELSAKLRETSEAKLLTERAGTPPLVSLEGIGEIITLAKKGACLTAEQLDAVATALTAVRRLKDYLCRCKQYEAGIAYYEENLEPLEAIRKELNEKIRNQKVDDYATKELKNLRSKIEMTERAMRDKADAIMRANKESMSDNYSTIKNGHICIPVKKDCKFRISGSVIERSSTGGTLFMEPTAVAKLNEDLTEVRIAEENETRRILYTLSAMLADVGEEMDENLRTIERLDFMFAKGKLSIAYSGCEPKINTEHRITILEGRHPLMDKSICVPLDFQIGGEINGVIITGPNTGGKTVAIKTVALNAMMAQSGLHVACQEADFCMCNAFLCDIGDGQNISENLSTFSAHVTNILEILKRANRDSLVVLDELGSGTDPNEGMGIAIAVLEELKKSGTLYLVTTHYPEIKAYANREEGVINARMTFDKESLKPLYRLVIGEAGESCALYIAKRLGMPEEMIKRAEIAAYHKEDENTPHLGENAKREKISVPKIKKKKTLTGVDTKARKYNLGDSVMILPDKKIGIVCQTANDKGVLRVQLKGKKIWIHYKHIQLVVAASELYPPDYDFSIVFDSVENRKARHQMERKYCEDLVIEEEI